MSFRLASNASLRCLTSLPRTTRTSNTSVTSIRHNGVVTKEFGSIGQRGHHVHHLYHGHQGYHGLFGRRHLLVGTQRSPSQRVHGFQRPRSKSSTSSTKDGQLENAATESAAESSTSNCSSSPSSSNASSASSPTSTSTSAAAESASSTSTSASSSSPTASSSSASASSTPLAQTLTAMTLAILTVSAGVSAAETLTAPLAPKFDPQSQRFDQSTFVGRLSKMLLACDPALLMYGEVEVRRCQEMVEGYEGYLNEAKSEEEEREISRKLWEAQRIASAALHPDTGDVIPHPFRMSGYVPFNGPICVAMVASQSTSALLFWSWVNQSQNALVNYYNRNASSEMTNQTLFKSYAAAVGSALAVAFGLATLIQNRYSPSKARELLRWVSFPSAVVASSLNCYIVRSPEIGTGVPLLDAPNPSGKDVLPGHTSKVAAERGVNSTTLSRAVLQAPVYFLPPLLMSSIPVLKNALAKNPMVRVPMTTYLLLVCFGIGLPASVAIFPQMGEIRVEEAEEEYRGLKRGDGREYEVLYYNKGL